LKLAHGGVKACNGRFESVRDGQKIQPGDAFRGTFNISEFVDLKPLRSGSYVEYSGAIANIALGDVLDFNVPIPVEPKTPC